MVSVSTAADRGNTSFLAGTNIQFAVDSTSIGAMKSCWRYYQLSIIEGWEPKSRATDLSFGIWMHEGRERYYRDRAKGVEHDQALRNTIMQALVDTYDVALGHPWTSGHPQKTRLTLIRTLCWYLDQWANDPLEQVILADGRPAVELSFAFDLDYLAANGQPYKIAGHLDRLVRLQDGIYGSDLKSTKTTLSPTYFSQFSPDNQMSLYTYVLRTYYDVPARGMIIDAAQVAVSFSRFERGMTSRTPDQLAEWHRGLGDYLRQAYEFARADFWPMNERACFRCSFRSICAKSPSVRDAWLQTDFVRRIWNPLIQRGDI